MLVKACKMPNMRHCSYTLTFAIQFQKVDAFEPQKLGQRRHRSNPPFGTVPVRQGFFVGIQQLGSDVVKGDRRMKLRWVDNGRIRSKAPAIPLFSQVDVEAVIRADTERNEIAVSLKGNVAKSVRSPLRAEHERVARALGGPLSSGLVLDLVGKRREIWHDLPQCRLLLLRSHGGPNLVAVGRRGGGCGGCRCGRGRYMRKWSWRGTRREIQQGSSAQDS